MIERIGLTMEKIKTNEREREWDYIKGFLVIMVILGHTTAAFGTYAKPQLLIYLSSLTVSFIMPLFLVTTGYFLIAPHKPLGISYFKKKARRFLIPAFVWGGIVGCVSIMKGILIDNEMLCTRSDLYQFMHYIASLWYLYAAWICSVIIGGIVQWIPDKFRNCSLIICAISMNLIPTDRWYVAFAFSFILIGYFLRIREFKLEYFESHFRLGIVFLIVYMVLLKFYKYEHSIYIAGNNLFTNDVMYKQMLIDVFRFVMGILGSISITFILHWIWKMILDKQNKLGMAIINAMEKLGKLSLEMYCTQYLVVEHIFPKILKILNVSDIITSNPYVCYSLWRHVIGIGLTFVVYNICCFLKKKIGRWLY